MQKRSSPPLSRVFSPMRLPSGFPMKLDYHRQADRPITTLHYHDCLEVGYCHRGSGIFLVEEKVFRFEAGDVCVVSQDETHLAQSTPGTTSEWHFLFFDPVALAGPLAGTAFPLDGRTLSGRRFENLLTPHRHPGVVLLVREILAELTGTKAHSREAVRGLVWTLMSRLHRLPGRQEGRGRLLPRQREARIRISPALQRMGEAYAGPLPVPVLAASCSCSVPHFRRLFRQAIGCSPLEHLARLRIQAAAAMLTNTDSKIIDIAGSCGFPTLSSFNRLFRRLMGLSPHLWKNSRRS